MTGQRRIKELIANRAPLLLVDRIVSAEPGVRVVTRKAVSAAEPCYHGLDDHASDDDYAYPAALLVESWCQSAALLVAQEEQCAGIALAGTLRSVRFGPPVFPGDVLEHEVRLVRAVGATAICTGETASGGDTVLRVGQFVVARVALGALAPGGVR